MRGKTLGEARKELVASGMKGETLDHILPHKVNNKKINIMFTFSSILVGINIGV